MLHHNRYPIIPLSVIKFLDRNASTYKGLLLIMFTIDAIHVVIHGGFEGIMHTPIDLLSWVV